MDRIEVYEMPAVELNEGVTDTVHQTLIREIPPMQSKSSLDKTAEKNAKLARIKSKENNSKEDFRAPWDPHHTQCTQDSMQSLR